MLGKLIALVVGAAVGAGTVALLHHQPSAAPILSATDIGFAQDMSVHHQQAVVMSDMLTADAGPEVKALAEQIRFTQLNEIGQMTGWLQLAGAPPAGEMPMAWMHDGAGMDHQHGMPGMASVADLKALQRATGRANEVQYLQLMYRHHQGGIAMAGYAVQHSDTEVVRRAAAVMVDEQTQELQVMATLLAGRNSEPLPFP